MFHERTFSNATSGNPLAFDHGRSPRHCSAGRLVVSRVSPDGPADLAGLRAGDIILSVGSDGVRTQEEFYHKVWGRGAAGTDIPLRVLQGVDIKDLNVHSIDRIEYFRSRTTY